MIPDCIGGAPIYLGACDNPPTDREVVRAVCAWWSCGPIDLRRGHDGCLDFRTRSMVRRDVVGVIRELCPGPPSYPTIAPLIGCRWHSTAFEAGRRFDGRYPVGSLSRAKFVADIHERVIEARRLAERNGGAS